VVGSPWTPAPDCHLTTRSGAWGGARRSCAETKHKCSRPSSRELPRPRSNGNNKHKTPVTGPWTWWPRSGKLGVPDGPLSGPLLLSLPGLPLAELKRPLSQPTGWPDLAPASQKAVGPGLFVPKRVLLGRPPPILARFGRPGLAGANLPNPNLGFFWPAPPCPSQSGGEVLS